MPSVYHRVNIGLNSNYRFTIILCAWDWARVGSRNNTERAVYRSSTVTRLCGEVGWQLRGGRCLHKYADSWGLSGKNCQKVFPLHICAVCVCASVIHTTIFFFSFLLCLFDEASKIRHKDFRPDFRLLKAQGTPPGFWNGVYWRALVELRPPNIGKLRGQRFLCFFSAIFFLLL